MNKEIVSDYVDLMFFCEGILSIWNKTHKLNPRLFYYVSDVDLFIISLQEKDTRTTGYGKYYIRELRNCFCEAVLYCIQNSSLDYLIEWGNRINDKNCLKERTNDAFWCGVTHEEAIKGIILYSKMFEDILDYYHYHP